MLTFENHPNDVFVLILVLSEGIKPQIFRCVLQDNSSISVSNSIKFYRTKDEIFEFKVFVALAVLASIVFHHENMPI